ncbi:MAG: hypothetical protein WB763_17000 [Terriglobia bacterium]
MVILYTGLRPDHPEYRLVLDQVACVRPVLESCPEQSALAFQLGFPAQDD